MPKFTQAEVDDMYRSYRRGWSQGASGGSPLDEVGTQCPAYESEYQQGFSDGREAFNAAMRAKTEALWALVGKRAYDVG